MANIEQARIHRGPLGPKESHGGLAPISENEELMQSLVREREGRSAVGRLRDNLRAVRRAHGCRASVQSLSRRRCDLPRPADLVAKEQYERARDEVRARPDQGPHHAVSRRTVRSLPFNTNHGQCALEENQCDKYYLGTFQYVDGTCTHGEPGGIGCVVSQGCRFCRLIGAGCRHGG